MKEYDTYEVCLPVWLQRGSLDEADFCQEFLSMYPLVYVDGNFFSCDGWVPEEKVRQFVYDYLAMYVTSGLSKKLPGLMEVLRLQARKEELDFDESILHCGNGDLNVMNGSFSEGKTCCRNRLKVNYSPQAPEPVIWKQFLSDLLEPEDILTLQEYLGYCLIPVNYGQKMMLLVGKGGEGKSRIGVMLSHLLGDNMCNGSLSKVEASPFARADLQQRLVMVDDDLRLEALSSTNYIKSLITAEQKMDLERKGQQSYQAMVRCRFLAFGNGNLRSLHDRSLGFFRRQIILTVKDRPKNRQDDPLLGQRFREELEGILLWCLEGLQRLMKQSFKFTLSQRTRRNILDAISEGDNVTDFMRSKGYIRFDTSREITSRKLYSLYREWCDDNVLYPVSPRSFSSHLMQNQQNYNIQYSTHIQGGDGREVRGFKGIVSQHGFSDQR